MRVTIDTPELKVIDDLLPEHEYKSVLRAVKAMQYLPVKANTEAWRNVESENPLQSISPMIWLSAGFELPLEIRAVAEQRMGMQLYPTGTEVDSAFVAIKREAVAVEHILGREGQDWVGFTSRAYAYGQGCRIDWHGDGVIYTGAFTYYVHEIWEHSWGGDLLVQSPFCEQTKENIDRGIFVSPLPNRLVLLKGGMPHSVARVSTEIGDGFRRSIAGFFATPSHAASLMASVMPTAGAKH